MWVYGFHPVREALRRGAVRRVEVRRGKSDARRDEIETLCRERRVTLSEVTAEELDRRASGIHNGFAAEVEEVGKQLRREVELVVLVEDVEDPRNLGALLRVCDAAGVDRVLVRDRGSAEVTAAVVKTSAGAAEWLDVERITNTANELERWKREGFWVYGAAAGGAPPWELDLRGKVVLCVGGERKGLRRLTRERCDALVGLPMRGRVESMNLATAAAAILFEIVRQRAAEGGSGP